jgi:hypothetical protein
MISSKDVERIGFTVLAITFLKLMIDGLKRVVKFCLGL